MQKIRVMVAEEAQERLETIKDYFKNVPDINEIMKNPGKVPYIDKQQKIKYDPSPKAPMPKANFVETNKILGR